MSISQELALRVTLNLIAGAIFISLVFFGVYPTVFAFLAAGNAFNSGRELEMYWRAKSMERAAERVAAMLEKAAQCARENHEKTIAESN